MKIDFQEKIDNYVLGKMSAEDRDKFEKEVSQDKEKQEQLKLTQNVSTAIKSRNEKLAMMQKWEQERIASKRKIMAWTSSAVGVAAVFLIGFFLFVPKKDVSEMNFNAVRVNENKTFGSLRISNNKTLQENAGFEMLAEEHLSFIRKEVNLFIHYLNKLGDVQLPVSERNAYNKKVLDYLMDAELMQAIGKDRASALFFKGIGTELKVPIENYLQRVKNGAEISGKLKSIMVYEVDKASICGSENGLYTCSLYKHVYSIEMNTIFSVKEKIYIDSRIKDIINKREHLVLGTLELVY